MGSVCCPYANDRTLFWHRTSTMNGHGRPEVRYHGEYSLGSPIPGVMTYAVRFCARFMTRGALVKTSTTLTSLLLDGNFALPTRSHSIFFSIGIGSLSSQSGYLWIVVFYQCEHACLTPFMHESEFSPVSRTTQRHLILYL